MEITLKWADDASSFGRAYGETSTKNEVRYLSQNYVERICAKDGITKELVREIEEVIFHYLDPTDTLNASNFEELRALKTEGVRNEGERLRAEVQSVIREECALRDLISKLPEKRARLTSLSTEREGLIKQIPPPASAAEARLLEELQKKRDALTKVQQAAATEKQRLQRLIDLKTRVGAIRAQMDRFYSELQPLLKETDIPEAEWNNFRTGFSGNVDQSILSQSATISRKLTVLEGGEPPADNTIRKLTNEIATLVKRETNDKARQERTKQIQTRVAAISGDIERIEAEIKSVVEIEKPRVAGIQARRLQAYVAFFENMQLEQKALQGLYEPIRDRLSARALLKGKELEFSIKWSVNILVWLERGAALFDQRRTLPYGSFEKLSEEAKRKLLPAWASGDHEKIRVAFEGFMAEFRNEGLPPKDYMRSGVTIQDVLTWLYEVDHISLEYGLKFNGAELENLSPGTKGIVLLILYLGMDINDTRPLIVDQPDENLDNESIYSLLTPYFQFAKIRRQIIVITHNPNLVVNSDSEQVIIASSEKQENGFPVIHYVGGALENNQPPETGIRQRVCLILEGGDIAFSKRERRYALHRQPAQ